MSVWIDRLVVTIVAIGGLFIMYRALKEPMDAFFGLVGRGFHAMFDKVRGINTDQYRETITYG